MTKGQQEAYAEAFDTIPVNKEAQGVVTESYNISALEAFNKAAYSMQFLDTVYGQNVGNAMNIAVVNLMARQGLRRRHRQGRQSCRREGLSKQT
ncbi:hypothetical protein LUW77_04905 [Streptomyces radiopugnans]|nr:hypothetical protein LUW77_04905 [Streptomyces radiopugnans]